MYAYKLHTFLILLKLRNSNVSSIHLKLTTMRYLQFNKEMLVFFSVQFKIGMKAAVELSVP